MHFGYLLALIFAAAAALVGIEMVDYRATPQATPSTNPSTSTPPRPVTRATSTTHAAATAPAILTAPASTTAPITNTKVPTTTKVSPAKTLATTTPSVSVQSPIKTPVIELPAPVPPIAASDLNTAARNALVNIFCDADPLSLLPSTIGSGMIIDPRGIILTNAHVAENLLLESYRVPNAIKCYARNGSPARTAYKVKLLYLPPSWVSENAPHITSSAGSRTGMGKHDFALLYITETATETALPTTFPFIPLEHVDSVDVGEEVFAAAYPAELLPERNKLNALYPVSAYSKVEHYITFTKDILDEIYLSGNAVSQTGASGGGVITSEGKLYAVITTVTDGATPQDRDFQAITIPYISREFLAHTGLTLEIFLSKDPISELANYRNNVAPALTTALVTEYQKVHGQ